MAAFFNPKPVTYTPSQATIAGAGALGNSMYDIWLKNYQQKQQDRQLQNAENTLAFNQENEGIKNAFNQQKENNENFWKEQTHNLKVDEHNLNVKKDNDAYFQNVNKGSMYAGTQGIDTTGWTDSQLYGLSGLYQQPNYTPATMGNQDGVVDKSSGSFTSIATHRPTGDGSGTGKMTEYQRAVHIVTNPHLFSPEEVNFSNLYLEKNLGNSAIVSINNFSRQAQVFAESLGLKSYTELGELDTSKLSKEQRIQAQQLAQLYINAYKTNNPELEKNIGEYNAMVTQSQVFYDQIRNISDFRVLDETVKTLFSNYFGLSESQMKSEEAMTALQSVLNLKIRIDSGLAVSNQEMVRTINESTTKYRYKNQMLIGMKNILNGQLGRLQGLKMSIGDIPFNLKYGAVERRYENMIEALNYTMGANSKNKDLGFGGNSIPSSQTQNISRLNAKNNTQQNKIIRTYEENGQMFHLFENGDIGRAK